MRRSTLALLAAAALLLGGCAQMAGDGDVSGDWAVLPKAEVPVPAAGVCRVNVMSEKYVDWDLALLAAPAVECGMNHAAETYHVGRITDAKTRELSSPPDVGDALFKPIYTTCVKQAKLFLGGDYHDARVSIVPVLPTDTEWRGEGRFFRCEMFEISDGDETIVERTGSLKDGLLGSRPAALQCVNYTSDDEDALENFRFLPCSKSHLAEYTGTFTPKDGKYPGDTKVDDQGSAGCFAVGARYLGMSVSALDASGGFQWIHDGMNDTLWSIGERSQRCYIGPYPDKKIKGSVKGKSPSRW
ncbi:septum formation family protein [Luedemannella flava]|uniref:septum formation family protein n=1 Tax=Luedemannella flava TaxID=349316 RepID=UPI0031D2F486